LRRYITLKLHPLQVSEQAIAKRLDTLPASALAAVLIDVSTRLQAQPPPQLPGLERWAEVRARFSRIAMVDGSTLEALRKKTQTLQAQPGLVLAGRMMAMVEAFTHRPLWHLYTEDAAANDKRFATEILAAVPEWGLLIFDLGFFSFLWFDEFTDHHKFFVTRMRQKTAYRVTQVLAQSPYYRDELIAVGLHHSNPCRHLSAWSPCCGAANGIVTSPTSLILRNSRHETFASCIGGAGVLKTLF
jgi:hypothetical protein